MIIGAVGFIGSGKNAVGDILTRYHGFQQESFASTLKDVAAKLFDWPRELLEGNTDKSRKWREEIDPLWSEMLGIPDFTPRKALQLLGTDVLRQGFHQDIWMLCLKKRLINIDCDVVITDVRFPNEMDMIKSLGGEIWMIHRGPLPNYWNIARHNKVGMHIQYPDIHPSEYEWISGSWKHELLNDGKFSDLIRNVNSCLTE
tara:strand:+ start:378 stop:980 length:603 start_codon:yes stop_codon:yes gene_type:complete